MNDERFLDAEELGERLGVGKSTIYRMHAKGLIPALPVGAGLSGKRFSLTAVCDALAKVTVTKRPYHPPKAQRETMHA